MYASLPGRVSSCNIDFPFVYHPCTVFKRALLTEVAKLILSSPNMFCELDPIPTFVIKCCLHTLIVTITTIINV